MAPRRYRMDTRAAAVEQTRQRIVEAAVALHREEGVLATSWEDIAKRADVALGTVYRHFPSRDALVKACGKEVSAIIQPAKPEDAERIFANTSSLEARIGLLIDELFAFYERGSAFIELQLRERQQVPGLAASSARRDAGRDSLVREALRNVRANEQTVHVVSVLTDFPVWKSLEVRGVEKETAAATIKALLLAYLTKARRTKNAALSPKKVSRKEPNRSPHYSRA